MRKKKFAGFALFGFFVLMMLVSPVWTGTNVKALTTADRQYSYIIDPLKNTVEITEYLGNGTTVDIPKTIDGMPVTKIGDNAFSGCESLKNVTIPYGVTSIGSYAFHNCKSLVSIQIPDSVTSIGEYALSYCRLLESVTIPSRVKSISDYMFYYCYSLTSVEIPNGVTSIGSGAFSDCIFLTDINIPDSVNDIGTGAFWRCSALENISIPEGVVNIGNSAFWGCTSLKSITIPDGVSSIGDQIFYNCKSLTWITLPDGITSIGKSAFQSCGSLTRITLPNSLREIGIGAFYNCTYLKDILLPDGVASIGDSAFSGCASLTSITIPGNVVSIGNYAFQDCSSLSSITISNGVTKIGASAFRDCTSLTSVVIPNSVTYLGDYAFNYCLSLENVVLSGKMTTINDYTFGECVSLTDVTIPNGIVRIDKNAFYYCKSLRSIVIPSSVLSIGDRAFYSTLLKTIYGESGSLAESYAREHEIAFQVIGKDNYGITGVKIAGRAGDALRVNWDENYWVSGYILEQYKNGKWERIARIGNSTTTTYRIEKLSPGTSYQFRICGFGFNGGTAVYGSYTYVNGKTNPSAMTGVKIGGWATDALRINWTKNPTAAGYIIEQYQSGKWVRIAKITNNATSTYRVEKLRPGTTYQFRIQAFSIDGNTALYGTYTYVNGKTNPSAMTGVKIGGRAADALRINWTKNTSAAGYIIEQYQSGKWVRIAKITNNATTTYRVEKLSPCTTYQFRIQAFNIDGNTALYGSYTYISGKTNPSAMIGVKIGGWASNALRINWTKNPTAAGYIIEQYQSGKWVRIARIANNSTTTYRVENLSPGTTYQFRILAFNFDGSTPLYGNYTYVNGKTNPSAVSGVKIGGWAKDALRINWTKNPTAAGYIIEQYQSGKWVRIAKITNNATTTYRVENLSSSTTYKFRIQAFNMDGNTPLYGLYTYVNGQTM